ncbi:MAG: type VI secretion system baseplate subunit TssF [Lentisphaerae bacterium]|nr:type VI secretion system baseplate subunit TssF [Lentisphaerota bacterium]MCP4101010.1 type VI secretion system baseplate subunit TssF [Lentisphaerota bacterium]
MDKQFLEYYDQELGHLRTSAMQFAEDFPKIASRLQLSKFDCADPYVERLLEGFAFMAARVRKKLDDGMAGFTETVLDAVFPLTTAPIPSMGIVKLVPDLSKPELLKGIEVPKGTKFTARSLAQGAPPVIFTSCTSEKLYALKIDDCAYLDRGAGEVAVAAGYQAGAVMRFTLSCPLEQPLSRQRFEKLNLFLDMDDSQAVTILRQLESQCVGVYLSSPDGKHSRMLTPDCVKTTGFSHHESMLPMIDRTFNGNRLLIEYFAFHSRFKFFQIKGLRDALVGWDSPSVEMHFLLEKPDVNLAGALHRDSIKLFCIPVVNLFRRHSDRVPFTRDFSYHVVVDRTDVPDYEIYGIEKAVAYDRGNSKLFDINRFYHTTDRSLEESRFRRNYFSVRRRRRELSSSSRRSSYYGSEIFISFSGEDFRKYSDEIHEFGFQVLCTNRDLPLFIVPEDTLSSPDLEGVSKVNFVVGPSEPLPPLTRNESNWSAINLLRMNYASLFRGKGHSPAKMMRTLLAQHCPAGRSFGLQQIQGIQAVKAYPVTRSILESGRICSVRGLEIVVTVDEQAFAGMGCYLLMRLLREYFCTLVALNSFVEVAVCTNQQGEIIRWKPRMGIKSEL